MSRRKTKITYPADWTVSFETTANGRHIEPGTELSIKGERGRFRFLKYVEKEDGSSWIDCVGGTKYVKMMRSFRVDRIKRVHRIRTVMTNSEARELVNAKNRIKRETANA